MPDADKQIRQLYETWKGLGQHRSTCRRTSLHRDSIDPELDKDVRI